MGKLFFRVYLSERLGGLAILGWAVACEPAERYFKVTESLASSPNAAAAYCAESTAWPSGWVAWEVEALALINAARAGGGWCGTRGEFAATGKLELHPKLTCAARVHAKDMATTGVPSHVGSDGSTPFDRLLRAGYAYGYAGENVAAGAKTPAEVVAAWLASDDHCAVLLDAIYREAGIAFAASPSANDPFGVYWSLSAASLAP